MKKMFHGLFVASFLLLLQATPAHATIETIKGSLTCFVGCNRDVVQLIAQGENHSFEVVGRFVDTSTAVQIIGSGVSVSYGTRTGGANSSIIVRFAVDNNAAPGERTVRMRYAIETNGPDTFKVRVVRKRNHQPGSIPETVAISTGRWTSHGACCRHGASSKRESSADNNRNEA